MDKKLLLNHVLYEFQMYQQSFLILCLFKKDIEKALKENNIFFFDSVVNSLYDSCALHLRILFQFFSGKGKYDDITYEKILGKRMPEFDLSDEYMQLKETINKCVVHLTEKRTNEEMINRNNSDLFFYCYYSAKDSSFRGLGNTIKDFFIELTQSDNLPDSITKELKKQEIEELMELVKTDNSTLLDVKNNFSIKIDKKRKIDVKVTSPFKLIYTDYSNVL